MTHVGHKFAFRLRRTLGLRRGLSKALFHLLPVADIEYETERMTVTSDLDVSRPKQGSSGLQLRVPQFELVLVHLLQVEIRSESCVQFGTSAEPIQFNGIISRWSKGFLRIRRFSDCPSFW